MGSGMEYFKPTYVIMVCANKIGVCRYRLILTI